MSRCARPRATEALQLLPATLLVGIAVTQIVLSLGRDLSPWLGGGFGMFATLDTRVLRHVHLVAHGDGVIRELDLPRELEVLEARARAFPTHANLQRLARAIEVPSDLAGLHALEIQVWKVEFDPHSLAPRSHLLRAHEFPLDAL
jgi:hypothetical protein